jgi:hypothetical protein
VDEIGDQIVEPAGFADQADQRLARHGLWRGEDGGFDAQHPFPPARGCGQVGELDVETFVSAPLATAGGGGHRPYSRLVLLGAARIFRAADSGEAADRGEPGMIRAPTFTASIRPALTSRLTVLSLTSPRSACVALIESALPRLLDSVIPTKGS